MDIDATMCSFSFGSTPKSGAAGSCLALVGIQLNEVVVFFTFSLAVYKSNNTSGSSSIFHIAI